MRPSSLSANKEPALWYQAFFWIALLIAADVLRIFDLPILKQIPLLCIGIVTIIHAFSGRWKVWFARGAWGWYTLLLLLALPGVVINKLAGSQSSMFTAIAQGWVVISLCLLGPGLMNITPSRIIHDLENLGWVFVLTRIAANLIRPAFPVVQGLTHELAFFVPMLLVPSISKKQWWRSIIALSAVAVLIALDPKTTLVAVTVLTAVGAVLFQSKHIRIVHKLAAIVLVLCVAVLPLLLPLVMRLDEAFRQVVGRTQQGGFRTLLMARALSDFLASPVFGDWFTGPTGYSVRWGNQFIVVPLHNDFLDFLTKGGSVGLGIFLIATAVLVRQAVKDDRVLRLRGDESLRRLNEVLLFTLIGSLLVMFANPVINMTRSGFVVYFIIGLLLQVGRVVRREPASEISVEDIKQNKL